jgi:hypothetical protein
MPQSVDRGEAVILCVGMRPKGGLPTEGSAAAPEISSWSKSVALVVGQRERSLLLRGDFPLY